jgi:hypothetical protein
MNELKENKKQRQKSKSDFGVLDFFEIFGDILEIILDIFIS